MSIGPCLKVSSSLGISYSIIFLLLALLGLSAVCHLFTSNHPVRSSCKNSSNHDNFLHTYMCTCVYTRVNAYTHLYRETYTQTHTKHNIHTDICTHTYTHTETHTHTDTHRHTHTHTYTHYIHTRLAPIMPA